MASRVGDLWTLARPGSETGCLPAAAPDDQSRRYAGIPACSSPRGRARSPSSFLRPAPRPSCALGAWMNTQHRLVSGTTPVGALVSAGPGRECCLCDDPAKAAHQHNRVAHLTPADVESIGRDLDTIRQSVIDNRGARDAAYIRRVIDSQRKLEMAGRALLLAGRYRPAWVLGTACLTLVQGAREHGDRAQRHARPVGLDAGPEDPLEHLGVGPRLSGRAVEARRTTCSTTRSPTSWARTTTSATGSCASTMRSPGIPVIWCSRC